LISLLLLVILSGFMLLSIDFLSCKLGRTGWSRFVSTFLLFFAQIIGSEFVLGLFSLLTSFWLVITNVLLSAGLLFWLRRTYGTKAFKQYLTDLRAIRLSPWQGFKADPLWGILLALAGLFLAWIIFLGVFFPSTDWDGNSYHLTFSANVIQNHTFFDPATSLKWLAGYPKGGEFVQLWSVLITHNDMFTDLAQIPFLALGIYALYAIARRLGANKQQARFAALLFIFLPMVLNQLKTTYVDVMLCSIFFAGLAIVIKEKLGKLDLVLIGIIFSLLISIKSTGFLFVFALLPLLFWNLYKHQKDIKSGLVGYYAKSIAYITPALFFGLYWYFKNWIEYGSPIYPFGFKLAGHSIFPGQTFQEFAANAVNGSTLLPHDSLSRIWFVWTEQKDWFGCMYNYDTNYAGFGPIWFIILLPAFITALYLAYKKRNGLFAGVAATIAVLFAVYPSNYYTRYTIFVTAIGIISFGLILTYMSKLSATVAKLLTLALVLVVIGTNFTLCNFSPGTVKDQVAGVLHGSARGPVYNGVPGPAYVFLEGRERSGDVVAYDSSPYFIYPLWLPDFSNKVIYIPAKNQADWYNQLKTKNVKYVFTTVDSKEQKWAQSRLNNIYEDEMYAVYQVY
jgi:hypothetical protein